MNNQLPESECNNLVFYMTLTIILISFLIDIVEYFKRSSSALAKLKGYLQQNNMRVVKLKQDCPTRWNSTLDMVRRVLELKDAIFTTTALLRIDTNDPATRSFYDDCTFTETETAILTQLVKLLTLFETITNKVSAEKYVTCSKVLVVIKILFSKLKGFLNNVEMLEIKPLLQAVQTDCENRFLSYEKNDLLCQSTFLDPRYKKIGFRDETHFNHTSGVIQHRVALYLNAQSIDAPKTTSTTIESKEAESF